MHSVNTSRQVISSKQRNSLYRPNGQVAAHVAQTTFFDTSIKRPVRGCIAEENFTKGDITVRVGEKFYLANYKLPHRYYVVVNQSGVWKCSSSDDRVRAACVALAQAHIQKRNNLLLNGQY